MKKIFYKEHRCKYCDKSFEKGQQLGGHVRMCKLNPNYKKRRNKISKTLKGKKHTKETKEKISKSRKEYLNKNPDKIPYKLNHSSKKSWSEKRFENTLIKQNIEGWIYNYPFLRFSLDFAFPEYKLDVEIDGHTHTLEEVKLKDKERTKILNENGWEVIRFTAKEVKDNPFDCVQKIVNHLKLKIDIKIPFDFVNYKLNKRKNKKQRKYDTKKDYNKAVRQQNDQKWKPYIELVKNSNIDFSKLGWVTKTSKILNITPQKVSKWMKRNMNDFYEENCFKRK